MNQFTHFFSNHCPPSNRAELNLSFQTGKAWPFKFLAEENMTGMKAINECDPYNTWISNYITKIEKIKQSFWMLSPPLFLRIVLEKKHHLGVACF